MYTISRDGGSIIYSRINFGIEGTYKKNISGSLDSNSDIKKIKNIQKTEASSYIS